MVEDGRDCAEVIQQVSAAKAALDRAGSIMIAAGFRECLSGTQLDPGVRERIDNGLSALIALRG
jgi:DNA-binding FrmR family transcriptional regulator